MRYKYSRLTKREQFFLNIFTGLLVTALCATITALLIKIAPAQFAVIPSVFGMIACITSSCLSIAAILQTLETDPKHNNHRK